MAKAPQKRSTKRPGKDEIEAIFAAFERDNPEPKGELVATNAFTLLVAVVLSAQATDAGVNKATPALFKLADTPEKMVKLGVERITDLVKTIGLYRNKAKNVFALSQQLIEKFGGEVPRPARNSRLCRASAGRRPMLSSISPSGSPPLPSIRTSFASATAPASRAGQGPARGRAQTAQDRAGEIPPPRPSLADPPRPLVCKAQQTRMLPLHHRPMVPFRAENTAAQGLGWSAVALMDNL